MASGLANYLHGDSVVALSASGLTLINPGDHVAFSALWAMAADDEFIGSPAYRLSGIGIAVNPNPIQDTQGTYINNSGILVLTEGVFRVSAGNSGSALTIPNGAAVYPDSTGSGINGLTGGTVGASGVGATWTTAPPQQISANPTGAVASGIAVVIGHPVGGDSGAGQIDILYRPATNVGYF